MSSVREINVRMCEVRTGGEGDILRTTLGSCVGIGMLWRKRRIYGLAHCLLPEGSAPSKEVAAKYVSEAIPALFALMGVDQDQYDQLEAVLAGGACMVRGPIAANHMIGDLNVQAAERLLGIARIRIVHSDVGGTHGRQLLVDGGQHQYTVRKIGRTT